MNVGTVPAYMSEIIVVTPLLWSQRLLVTKVRLFFLINNLFNNY